MNTKELINLVANKEQREEIKSISVLLEKNDDTLYTVYCTIINEILFISSKEEFEDFINEEGSLNSTLFLLEYANQKGICRKLGGYSDEIDGNIISYLEQRIKIEEIKGVKLKRNYENTDDLISDLNIINRKLEPFGKKVILLFEDIYCEICYYIFLLDKEEVKENNWSDNDIVRLI